MDIVVDVVRERARRELGAWPSAESVTDRLVEALRRAEEDEQEPEQKASRKAARNALAGVAREVTVTGIPKQVGGGQGYTR